MPLAVAAGGRRALATGTNCCRASGTWPKGKSPQKPSGATHSPRFTTCRVRGAARCGRKQGHCAFKGPGATHSPRFATCRVRGAARCGRKQGHCAFKGPGATHSPRFATCRVRGAARCGRWRAAHPSECLECSKCVSMRACVRMHSIGWWWWWALTLRSTALGWEARCLGMPMASTKNRGSAAVTAPVTPRGRGASEGAAGLLRQQHSGYKGPTTSACIHTHRHRLTPKHKKRGLRAERGEAGTAGGHGDVGKGAGKGVVEGLETATRGGGGARVGAFAGVDTGFERRWGGGPTHTQAAPGCCRCRPSCRCCPGGCPSAACWPTRTLKTPVRRQRRPPQPR
jgi:hypothetical protein